MFTKWKRKRRKPLGWRTKKKQSKMLKVDHSKLKGGEVADWTYGNVLTRVYRNRTAKGSIYFTMIQDRIYKKQNGEVGTSKSFYAGDIQDMLWGAGQAMKYLTQQQRENSK